MDGVKNAANVIASKAATTLGLSVAAQNARANEQLKLIDQNISNLEDYLVDFEIGDPEYDKVIAMIKNLQTSKDRIMRDLSNANITAAQMIESTDPNKNGAKKALELVKTLKGGAAGIALKLAQNRKFWIFVIVGNLLVCGLIFGGVGLFLNKVQENPIDAITQCVNSDIDCKELVTNSMDAIMQQKFPVSN